jgi:CheY-like chemotaxis protein
VADGKRLLIVEDDADLAENLAEILEGMGYQVLSADSGERALELLEHEVVDGVITDFRLPGLDGVELIATLRAKGLPAPVVVISALIDHNVAVKAEEAGALDVLPKPVNFDRLFELLASFSRPRGQVLIVEDNSALAENVAEALENSGMRPLIGESAESALEQRTLPRVALVDMRLPDKSGLEVALRLLARDPTIKIIFVTAYGEELQQRLSSGIAALSGSLGSAPLVTKPFDLAALVERVQKAADDA